MINMVAKDITPLEYKIIKEFLPGPLTIILKKKNIVPNVLTNGGDTVGIRMPDNDIALNLSKYSNVPIAAPSANISNRPSGTNIESIYNDFHDNVDIYIDDGESKFGVASTIVKVENNNIKILREGVITLEDIINKISMWYVYFLKWLILWLLFVNIISRCYYIDSGVEGIWKKIILFL